MTNQPTGGTRMLTYDNNPQLRQVAIEAMANGLRDRRLLRGTYLNDGGFSCGTRGCAVGILACRVAARAGTTPTKLQFRAGSSWEEAVGHHLGLPATVMLGLERVFEDYSNHHKLSVAQCANRVIHVLRSIPVGAPVGHYAAEDRYAVGGEGHYQALLQWAATLLPGPAAGGLVARLEEAVAG